MESARAKSILEKSNAVRKQDMKFWALLRCNDLEQTRLFGTDGVKLARVKDRWEDDLNKAAEFLSGDACILPQRMVQWRISEYCLSLDIAGRAIEAQKVFEVFKPDISVLNDAARLMEIVNRSKTPFRRERPIVVDGSYISDKGVTVIRGDLSLENGCNFQYGGDLIVIGSINCSASKRSPYPKLTVNGTIKARTMTAYDVNAGAIEIEFLMHANDVKANSVKALGITANNLTADRIEAMTIKADMITTNSIAADDISATNLV